MQNYIILTDSGTDFSKELAQEADVRVIDLLLTVEGRETVPESQTDVKELYALLRDKKKASTAAINTSSFVSIMSEYLKQDMDVLYLGFSSALSSTYNSARLAAEELREQYPNRKIYTADTLCASLGQGLLVYLAGKKRLAGADIDEVKGFVEETKLHICHWFTVDDLFFLKRGGRVGAATAIVGTALGIKPIMQVDNEGRLIKISTARGRRNSIDSLFEKVKTTMQGAFEDATVFISHGDCTEDADYLAERIKNELGVKDIRVSYIGAVIGAHSGPGTLAVFYLGAQR